MWFTSQSAVHLNVTRELVKLDLSTANTYYANRIRMKIINSKLHVILPVLGVACFALGCSTLNLGNEVAQSVVSSPKVIEIECGKKTYEVQIDNLTPTQEKELEELKTGCRIDNVAHKLEVKPGRRYGVYDDPANRDFVPPDRGRQGH